MKRIRLFVLSALILCTSAFGAQQGGPWKAVDDAMGRQGQDQPDGTHRFNMPRSDLKVTANGVEIKPGFALGSWAAFQMMGNHSEVMGDLVLTESEVGPVMQKLVDSGIEKLLHDGSDFTLGQDEIAHHVAVVSHHLKGSP